MEDPDHINASIVLVTAFNSDGLEHLRRSEILG
jgi:hypothetical protein